MFGETTIFHVKIWNHPIETTIYKWLALEFQAGISLTSPAVLPNSNTFDHQSSPGTTLRRLIAWGNVPRSFLCDFFCWAPVFLDGFAISHLRYRSKVLCNQFHSSMFIVFEVHFLFNMFKVQVWSRFAE